MTLDKSDSEAPVMQELWGMRSTPLLPSHPRFTLARGGNTRLGHNYGSNRTKL